MQSSDDESSRLLDHQSRVNILESSESHSSIGQNSLPTRKSASRLPAENFFPRKGADEDFFRPLDKKSRSDSMGSYGSYAIRKNASQDSLTVRKSTSRLPAEVFFPQTYPESQLGPELYDKFEGNRKTSLQFAAISLLLFEIGIIFLFGFFSPDSSYEVTGDDSSANEGFNVGYSMFTGVLIMMFIGFGYLMTFLERYALGAIGFTFMLTVVIFQFALLVIAFFQNVYSGDWVYVNIDIYSMINSLFMVATILISFGGVIGKLSPLQLFVMALIETIVAGFNCYVLLNGYFHIVDPGSTIGVHTFGAFFGTSLAWMIGTPSSEVTGSYVADEFAFLGTLFLWIYWPMFVSGGLTAGSVQQQQAIINTLLSLSASTVGAFAVSSILSADQKFRPMDIQNATLAGGVAIGAVALLSMGPFSALLIGLCAGILSAVGYAIIQPFLLTSINLHDTCGINNLHGMPGVLGGLASVILAAWYNSGGRTSNVSVYGSDNTTQWAFQLAGLVCTIGMAMSSGLATGWLLSSFEGTSMFAKFSDDMWWETAGDSNAVVKNE